MIQLLKSWFKGLFTPRTKAQGLSNEPTYSQVERLIEAAGGASRQGGSLYSKPTYSQFERLIAALGGGSGSGSGSGLPAKRDKKGRVTGYGYERKTPVTNKEKAQRVSFAVISRAVAARVKAGDKRTRKEIWKEVKEEYETRES